MPERTEVATGQNWLRPPVGATLAGGLLDSTLGIGGLIWLMAGLSLLPATLWVLWLAPGRATRLAAEIVER